MATQNPTVYDGIKYGANEELPDLGSWVNVAESGSATRSYRGLSADFSKLPTVSAYPQYKGKLASGSLAIAADTGNSKMYESSTDTWY